MEHFDLVRTQANSVGVVCDLSLRAYVHEDTLRWEARRLLPLLGFIQSSRATSPGNVFRLKRKEWSDWLLWTGFDTSSHIGSSQRSLRVRNQSAEGAESQNWLSTEGVLLVTLGSSTTRQSQEHRTMSMRALESLLKHCTSEDVTVPA
eukprot:2586696-Amphidinium_carterae.1